MEELKKCVHDLLNVKSNHLPLLQHVNELLLRDYYLSLGGYLTLIPKEVEIYYVNRKATPPFVDTNMQCMVDPKTNDEIWNLQSGRFGQLYFHQKGSGGIDVCLSDSHDYALCCSIKAAEVNGEECWSPLKVRNRLVEIILAKVYAEQVKKAQTLVAGLKANFNLVKSRCDITMEQVKVLEEEANEAARMNAEVEALREEVNMKASLANRKLIEMKDAMMNAKKQIKSSFDPFKWFELGVLDKR